MTANPGKIEKLTTLHDFSTFDCGKPSLTGWLKRFALINQQNDSARTYLFVRDGRVMGYYSLSAGSVRREEAPARIAKGVARHPVGVILLARLAVDLGEQRTGLGERLPADALGRCLSASESIGARAVLVHAIDDQAAAFYKKFGFEESVLDSQFLMLLMNGSTRVPCGGGVAHMNAATVENQPGKSLANGLPTMILLRGKPAFLIDTSTIKNGCKLLKIKGSTNSNR